MIVSAIIVSWLLRRPVEIKPLFVSKMNTAAQIAFAALVLSTKAFGIDADGFYGAGMILVALLTIVSAGAYLARWMKHMTGNGHAA
jgi:cardiolipin synthase